MNSAKLVYLDHAATTPLREVARHAWLEAAVCVNPAGQYASARKARSYLDTAREKIAAALGCEPIEVIFTSSGTEANNIGVLGFYRGGRIVTTEIEHPSVAEAVSHAQQKGAEIAYLGINNQGVVTDLSALEIPADVVCCMWANNETGAIQPIEKVVAAAENLAKESGITIPVHVDAVQIVGHESVNFSALGATTLAASAHKFGGPRGVGILLAKRSPAPGPVSFGGKQERGIRSGTVDVAGAYATAIALEEACAELSAERKRLSTLRDKLWREISTISEVRRFTPMNDNLAGHLHVAFPGAEGDSLIMLLDQRGIEVSTGSACHNGVNSASETLLAMGIDEKTARSAVRFTLGRTTTDEDIDLVLQHIGEVTRLARQAGMA
ncbi:cysteine desulfurase family protein [Corynebacterium kutscheri]|uniref:Cysteine desulfurase n=1 Tax=Corynebacterium kutscheri TaxID=35755 RepID=A0AB38VS61_9CORY|nr:cysteine desulfurase family protein [Corynebacterium kutscheri]VEH06876.1 cysteine desulfurase [Corynebacterium kutscheri]